MAKTKEIARMTASGIAPRKYLGESPIKKAKNVKKRAADNPPTGEMVMAALKALKDERGVSMVAIRKYLFDNFGGFGAKIGKQRREEIKEFIIAELKSGKILTTNAGADTTNFEKSVVKFGTRFNIK